MNHAKDFDAISLEDLRAVGGVKWTAFPRTIGAFVAEMDFGTAPSISQAMHSAIDTGLLGYLPSAVSQSMSQASADWLRSSLGWEVPAERIHPIADVIKGLELAVEHYSAPGSKVILPTPAYMPFFSVPPALGREIIEVPMLVENGRYRLDLDGVAKAYEAGGDLLILCNPYNPVGRVFTRQELLDVSEVVAAYGGRVFSDEIHAPLVYPDAVHVPYASVSEVAASHTVTATSASKAWNLPGLKCAQFIISNDADAAIWEKVGMMATHGASNLGVIANTAAFSSGLQWLDDVIHYLDGNRRLLGELLSEHIPGIRYTPPEGTYIAWLDCRELALGDHPADFFREQAEVSLTEGSACGAPGTGFVRMIFATPRPILTQAVVQMADALNNR